MFNNNREYISDKHAHIGNWDNIMRNSSITYIYTNLRQTSEVPMFIPSLFDNGKIYNSLQDFYWRIQAVTFLTRLNERTVNWIYDYKKQNCKNCKNEYDISLYIRHGDKHKEMKLIDSDVYRETIKILKVLTTKRT